MSNTFEIDKITWNDLSLDDIYSGLNSCITSAGDDYLLKRLKNPYIKDCADFNRQRQLFDEAEVFSGNIKLNSALEYISKLKKYEFANELDSILETEEKKNTKHLIIDLLVLLSFGLIFVYPGPGIVAFFVMIAYSVSDYFKTKNIIAGKLTVFNYVIRLIKAAKKITTDGTELKTCEVYGEYIRRLKDISNLFSGFIRGTYLISEGARTNSNPLSIVFDYVRMIFHVDIIKYNSMISFLKNHVSEVTEYYEIIGQIDTAICFKNINKCESIHVAELCKPELSEKADRLVISDSYHPMIIDPVCNSIDTNKNILITGCNASGKSTFLKTVALNALFAQSFGVAFAKEYKGAFYKIYSSMALKDDINAGESYFMAEIKSLKRIVDANDNLDNSCKIICVIDEVLRGTNTVERIASSVEILKSLCGDKILCFAATHDLELTELLAEYYDNYHFTEEVLCDDVKFSYKINKGAAQSRNAIRLLSVLGYSDEIVNKATDRANAFVRDGIWKSV